MGAATHRKRIVNTNNYIAFFPVICVLQLTNFKAEWLDGQFRDCNGVSNQRNLPDDVIKLEAIFAAIRAGGTSLGPIGPIIIGGNGPTGGNGGSGGSGGSAAAAAVRPQTAPPAGGVQPPGIQNTGGASLPVIGRKRGQGGAGGNGGDGGEG